MFLQFDYTSFDDLRLLGKWQMTLLFVLFQILSKLIDSLLFGDGIGTIIISSQIEQFFIVVHTS